MATVPAEVKNLLRQLPRRWDETRFIDGGPGRFAVIARRAGKSWWVAGFNADDTPREVVLDAPSCASAPASFFSLTGPARATSASRPLPKSTTTRLAFQPGASSLASHDLPGHHHAQRRP